MNKIVFLITVVIFILFSAFRSVKSLDTSCNILHQGTFIYGNDRYQVRVVISGNKHTEYHFGGKYRIDSELKWENDCVMNLTLKKVTMPNFNYKEGDELTIKVDSVRGNQIYYTSTAYDKSWNGVFKKID